MIRSVRGVAMVKMELRGMREGGRRGERGSSAIVDHS